MLVVLVAASACGGGKKVKVQVFPVNVDGKTAEFAASFIAYCPNEVMAHPGDEVDFTEVFSGEPHTVTLGSDVDAIFSLIAEACPNGGLADPACQQGPPPGYEDRYRGERQAPGVDPRRHLLGLAGGGPALLPRHRRSAGGPAHLPGDFLYGDHREPYREAGLWGLFRVYPQGASAKSKLLHLECGRVSCGGRDWLVIWLGTGLGLLGAGAVLSLILVRRRRRRPHVA